MFCVNIVCVACGGVVLVVWPVVFVSALTQLDPRASDRISFADLVQWLKGQCEAQDNDRKFNRLVSSAEAASIASF